MKLSMVLLCRINLWAVLYLTLIRYGLIKQDVVLSNLRCVRLVGIFLVTLIKKCLLMMLLRLCHDM